MKLIYTYDDMPSHGFTGRKYVSDDYQPQAGETFVEPAKDKMNYFNGTCWVPETVTVYQVDSDGFLVSVIQKPTGSQLAQDEQVDKPANRPSVAKPNEPSAEQMMIMSQETKITQMQQILMQQQMQIATLKGGNA